VGTDPRWFDAIVPCGIPGCEIANLQSLLGEPVDGDAVREKLAFRLAEVFERDLSSREISAQSVQVIIWRATGTDLEILLVKRAPDHGGFWQPVTGLIERGESPSAAAAREAREETGLEGAITDLRFVRDFQIGREYSRHEGPYPWILREHAFALQTSGGDVRLSLEEHDECRWVSASEAARSLKWKGNREALKILISATAREEMREEISR
jgi:lipoyl(octanoyl) transferase